MKIVKWIVPALLFLVAGTAVKAQSPRTSGADTSHTRTNKQISDETFLSNGIREQILDIKIAQLAENRAGSPRVKQVARDIISDGRVNLRQLLVAANGKALPNVKQEEIDAVMNEVQQDSSMNASDPRAAATSGNTVTDSLGSGSSGSGNVRGQDTGTLAKTHASGNDPNYSEQGDYAYNNNLFMNEAEVLDAGKGQDFDTKWVELMTRIYQGKVDYYNQASAQVKDPALKQAITQAIPRIRMHNSTLLRARKGRDASQGMERRRQGDGKSGSGNQR